jgi:hypothetical protein
MAAESGRQPAAVKFPMLAYPTLTLMLAPLAATSISLLLAVAALPSLLLQPEPQLAAEPGPGPGEILALAQTAQGTWILNGMPLAPDQLARILRGRPPSVVALRFQPSASLTTAQVADSLAWLGRHSPLPVGFEALPLAR